MSVWDAATTGAILGVLVSAVACANTSQPASNTQAELLKNWALCRCLAKSDRSESARADAEKSAASYLEMGTAEIETYEKLERLVDGFLQRTYSGSVASRYDTMKCIDLFRSAELQKMVEVAAAPPR